MSNDNNILAVIENNSQNISNINTAIEQARTINDKVSDFGLQLKIASYIRDIYDNLSPDCVKLLRFLQNKNLGFKTDRENGYPDEVIKNCVVEAMIYGLKPLNNEFNILGGNMYTTKQGYERLVYQHPELEKIEIKNEPSLTQGGNWKILFRVSMKLKDKQAENFEETFSLVSKKGNFEFPLETILGKATRKILRSCYVKMNNGILIPPEGDVGDGEYIHPQKEDKHSEKISRVKQLQANDDD